MLQAQESLEENSSRLRLVPMLIDAPSEVFIKHFIRADNGPWCPRYCHHPTVRVVCTIQYFAPWSFSPQTYRYYLHADFIRIACFAGLHDEEAEYLYFLGAQDIFISYAMSKSRCHAYIFALLNYDTRMANTSEYFDMAPYCAIIRYLTRFLLTLCDLMAHNATRRRSALARLLTAINSKAAMRRRACRWAPFSWRPTTRRACADIFIFNGFTFTK